MVKDLQLFDFWFPCKIIAVHACRLFPALLKRVFILNKSDSNSGFNGTAYIFYQLNWLLRHILKYEIIM